eukprot:GEMP01005527.1.p1 GENE.GEMP01005527.1~~GEMP01005527.1.p1  ORF type:complete len:622 (+),score=120.42 GEMP01005527.1:67-1932(+)
MGNVECCVERDASSGVLHTRAVQLHPANTKPVDGTYAPLIRYWDPYQDLSETLEQKIALWPTKNPIDGQSGRGHKWDARSKVLYEFFHLSDADDDLFIEWENGEIRAVCRRMFVFDKLPVPLMNEQTWVALFREFERDDRNLLAFNEVCHFIKFIYLTVLRLGSGRARPVEVAPNVFLPDHPTAKVFDKTPKLDELLVARKLRKEEQERHLEMLMKRHKAEEEQAIQERARAENERKKAETERQEADKKRKEMEVTVRRNKENERNRLREAEEKRQVEVLQRRRTEELAIRKSSLDEFADAQLEVKKVSEESRVAQQKARQIQRESEQSRREAREAQKNAKRKKQKEGEKRQEEENAKKWEEINKKQHLTEAYTFKAKADDKDFVLPEICLETSERWYEHFKAHIDEIHRKVATWDDDHIYDTARTLFTLVDKDHDGYLHWNNSEIRNFVKSVFAEHGLPVPELSETQWNLMYKTFDTDNICAMDLRECAQFTRYLHEEAIAVVSEHPHDMPKGYKRYRTAIVDKLNVWDDISTQAVLEKLFKDIDCANTGQLEWNNSEIRKFVRLVFEAHGFPIPRMSETIWYQLYREVDSDGKYALSLSEAVAFAKHVYARILNFYPKT